jgi:glycosyltransferase involved in cell wall biosynthesis
MIVGGAQETVLLAAALADPSRFESVIVCGPQTGSEGSLHEEVRRRGVELVLVPELVREVHPVKDLRVVPALTKLFRHRGFDVVHTNSSKAGIVGRMAARRADVPTVIHTVHGWPFHAHQAQAVSATWKELERRAARVTHRLVVVADTDRDKGLAAGIGRPGQYRTIRSGVDFDEFRADPAVREEVRRELGIDADAHIIGSVARLSPQKDPLTLVRAAVPLLARRDELRLLIVGDGPLRGVVAEAVAAAGLTHRVTMTGIRTDVPRLLAAMDVFVLSSRWEGLPRTLLQAMSCGVPVVATAVDGVVDLVEDGRTGLLVPAADVSALSAAIERILDGESPDLSEAAQRRLPEFGAPEMVRRLEELYGG